MESSTIKILITDDDPDILEFVSYNLRKEGFQVLSVNNGNDTLKKAKDYKPHLIILDIMMPEMDGIEVCRELRLMESLNDTLIVFFTARGETYSQIAGLEAGADDYITKPIKPGLLISKVNSLLRRQKSTKLLHTIVLGQLIINTEQFKVLLNDRQIALSKKEFDLLKLLASKPNKVFMRDEIQSAVWSDDVIVSDKTIDVHIHNLREKLNIENIKTIKGVGYKYEFLE